MQDFVTPGGIAVSCVATPADPATALADFPERLDRRCGALFSSGIDYPGRYSRWEFGFIDPPLAIVGRGRRLTFAALSPRGRALLDIFMPVIESTPDARVVAACPHEIIVETAAGETEFAEEERSLRPSLVSPLRRLIGEFRGLPDRRLGLYGAFGYDLLFQFDPMPLRQPRPRGQNGLHLFLPDRLIVVDRQKEQATELAYEFRRGDCSTSGRSAEPFPNALPAAPGETDSTAAADISSDMTGEDYAAMVDAARERMRVGDIFEVVLSRQFVARYAGPPSVLYRRMREVNPSPYEFFIQLGREQLVGTSPEMFVRVEGDRVESCPISGTARRTGEAMEDAARLKALFNSAKDEVELTMCTDVDRNDKARVCEAGSVRLLARRQVETYTGLFHTVDHVEGRLRPGMTGLDAFLSHMWAVTLTGAPKRKAAEIIETLERGARGWYGGATGALSLNGDVNTGITIRTIHLCEGALRYRVGATIVWDSVGPEEDAETRTKATALFRVLGREPAPAAARAVRQTGAGLRVVLVDNDDSFVHTLADYVRQTGAEVQTWRHGLAAARLLAQAPDLVVHSPGPGRPADFGVPDLVRRLAAAGVPQFGVCLGLQGMVEAFGGALDVLPEPRHGKTWEIVHDGRGLFAGLPSPLAVGAYHSLAARAQGFPESELEVTAATAGGLVMAIRHRRLPLAAVQFHPESILSLADGAGHAIVANAVAELTQAREARQRA